MQFIDFKFTYDAQIWYNYQLRYVYVRRQIHVAHEFVYDKDGYKNNKYNYYFQEYK